MLSRATVDNRVPTVNMDRRSPQKVIPFAPEDNLGSDFKEMTMNTIDKILSNIGKDNDGLGPNWSPLERVVHKFHMWDVWYQVHEIFESKVLQNPPKPEVCSCLMDTGSNGIYQVCSGTKMVYIHLTACAASVWLARSCMRVVNDTNAP